MPSIALALVIRDEERFLRDHLAFHRFMGIERAYVYLDRCRDGTAGIVDGFDWAEAIPRDRHESEVHMSTFQTRCLADAADRARADGHDWLLHVDADEFARGPATRPEAGGLNRLPDGLDAGTDQVILPPVDALPVRGQAPTHFTGLTLFQHRGILRRPMLDPVTGRRQTLTKRLGHTRGKAMVRLAADVRPASAHSWVDAASGAALRSQRRGRLYHYVAVDARLWWEKHRKFSEYPATWAKGTAVSFPKQAWKEAAPRMTEAEAEAYFDRWVQLSPARALWARLTGRATRDRFVEEARTLW